MSDPVFDPSMKAALDRFTVPPLPADFAARVAAATADRVDPGATPPRWQSRGNRPGWRRRASIVGGGVALGLLSAAAAATGYLGEQARSVVREAPVIGSIIARVAPPPKAAAPKRKPVHVAKAAEPAPEPVMEVVPPPRRSEVIAQRIVERLERRAQQRRELGLPPRPIRRREIIRTLRELPPEERMEVVRELREIRRERIAERRRLRQEWRAERGLGQPNDEALATLPDAPPSSSEAAD